MNHLRFALLTLVFAFSFSTLHAQTQSNEAENLVHAAYDLYEQGKLDEALATSNKALALNPKEYRAYIIIAYVSGLQGKLDEESEALANALKIQTTDKRIYSWKARIDILRNDYDEAAKSARKAVALDPNYPEAHLVLGDIAKHFVKREKEAIAEYRTAISLDPQLYAAYEGLAEVLASLNQSKEAEDMYRRAIEADPKHMSGRFHLGRMLLKQGRLAEARELWNGRTSDEDNTRPRFIEELTRAENLKNTKEAVAQKPSDPDALIDYGLAIMEGDSWVIDGRQQRALVQFKRALALKPDYARAQYAIVKAYVQIADIDPDENRKLDLEMAKLRKLDAKLADELDSYRKSYQGGLIAKP